MGKEIECGTVRYCDDMTRLGAQLLSRALQVCVLNVLNPEDSEGLLQGKQPHSPDSLALTAESHRRRRPPVSDGRTEAAAHHPLLRDEQSRLCLRDTGAGRLLY